MQNWRSRDTENSVRYGTKCSNLFPENRKGCLDRKLLQRIGLDDAWRKDNYAPFFHQLILPICSVIKSGIRNGLRKEYYSKVEKWSNMYAAQLGLGGAY